MTGGPSIVFTRKAVGDETFTRNLSNVCKSIVGIDACQLYPFSLCQDMQTGLYMRWDYDTDMQKFKSRHNRSRKFEKVMFFYQKIRPECKIESFFTSGKQKKLDTKLKKCGSVSVGKVSQPIRRSKITSKPTFPAKDIFLQTPF